MVGEYFPKMSISNIKLNFFLPQNIVPMTLCYDLLPNFNESIHVHGCNLDILCSPLKNRVPKILQLPISVSWLRACLVLFQYSSEEPQRQHRHRSSGQGDYRQV